MRQIKLKTEDGKIINANTITVSNEPRYYLEEMTGLKFRPKKKDLYAQIVGVMTAYMCCNSPKARETANVFTAARLVISKNFADTYGGYVCLSKKAVFVYVPCPKGHYIIDGNTVVDGIVCGNWSYENAIKKVETISESGFDYNDAISIDHN